MAFRWPIMLFFALLAAIVGIVVSYVYPSPAYQTTQTIDLNRVDPKELIQAAGWRFAVVTTTVGLKAYDSPDMTSAVGQYDFGQIFVVVEQNNDSSGNPIYKSERGLWVRGESLYISSNLEDAVNAATDLRVQAVLPVRATATAKAGG